MSESPFDLDPPPRRPSPARKSTALPIFIAVLLAVVAAGVVLVVGVRFYLHWSVRDTAQKLHKDLADDLARESARREKELSRMQTELANERSQDEAKEKAAIAALEPCVQAVREGDWEKCVQLIREIQDKYPGTRGARKAGEWLYDPELKETARIQRRLKEDGERTEKERDLAALKARYDAEAKRRWDQEQAEKKEQAEKDAAAAKLKAKLKANETAAAGLLTIAREFADRGQTDKALDRLRKIVKDYPDTKAAGEARDLVKKLER